MSTDIASIVRRTIVPVCKSMLIMSALALMTGCSVDANQDKSSAESDSTSVEDSLKTRLVPVEVTEVQRGTIHDYINLDGTISTESSVDVYSLVSGHVAEMRVEAGDRVSVGDTLLVLEDAEIVLQGERTRMDMKQAEREWVRLQKLADKGLVSSQQLDQARYESESAVLKWKSADLALKRSRVTAPIGGIVAERLVNTGAWIQGSNPLFRLVDDRDLIAQLDLPERDLNRVALGMEVKLKVQSAEGADLRGWIKRISPVVNPGSGTLRVTIGVHDVQNRLRSGMYASFSIVTGTHENAVLIPKRSLLYERNRVVAFVIDDEKAHRRVLKRGFEDEDRIEVLEGLEHGEVLVLVGQNSLKDKSAVRIIGGEEN